MKIIYGCLILGGLTGCGDQGSESQVQAVKSQGHGQLLLEDTDSSGRSEVFELKSGAKDGSVYCERKTDGSGVISLGSFFEARSSGIREEVPLTGLHFKVAGIADPGSREIPTVIFNVDDSFPSSPQCVLKSKGIRGGQFSATLQCFDNLERADWGFLQISAKFSCPM